MSGYEHSVADLTPANRLRRAVPGRGSGGVSTGRTLPAGRLGDVVGRGGEAAL